MPPTHPKLVVRVAKELFTVTCAVSLMTCLRRAAPFPPPHPMVTGTLVGHTLRLLHAQPLMGREITLPPPYQRWNEVPQPRWASVWRDACELAIGCESFCRVTDKAFDTSALDDLQERLLTR